MLFSVIIPVFNVENYLDECLSSILSQVNAINNDLEILLIDDGSTDSSGNICDNYWRKNPELIKVFHKENQGLLATRRFGLKRAAGEYIVNCDSDDLFEPDMLYKLSKIVNKYNKPDVILFNYNYMENGCKKVAYRDVFSSECDLRVNKKNVLETFLKNHSVVSLCTKIYKRACIDIEKDYSSFYGISNGEDSLQSVELYNNADLFVYLNDELYDYRVGSGMTRNFDKNYYNGFKTVLELIRSQKENWQMSDFDELFAIKVLQTAGRAVTQSRYNCWKSYAQQREYLDSIRNDDIVEGALKYLILMRRYLQTDHYYLLMLLRFRQYLIVCMLLCIKNGLS